MKNTHQFLSHAYSGNHTTATQNPRYVELVKAQTRAIVSGFTGGKRVGVVYQAGATPHYDYKRNLIVLPPFDETKLTMDDLAKLRHWGDHEGGHVEITPKWLFDHLEDDLHKHIWNVLEDVRIETVREAEYPGMRVTFERAFPLYEGEYREHKQKAIAAGQFSDLFEALRYLYVHGKAVDHDEALYAEGRRLLSQYPWILEKVEELVVGQRDPKVVLDLAKVIKDTLFPPEKIQEMLDQMAQAVANGESIPQSGGMGIKVPDSVEVPDSLKDQLPQNPWGKQDPEDDEQDGDSQGGQSGQGDEDSDSKGGSGSSGDDQDDTDTEGSDSSSGSSEGDSEGEDDTSDGEGQGSDGEDAEDGDEDDSQDGSGASGDDFSDDEGEDTDSEGEGSGGSSEDESDGDDQGSQGSKKDASQGGEDQSDESGDGQGQDDSADRSGDEASDGEYGQGDEGITALDELKKFLQGIDDNDFAKSLAEALQETAPDAARTYGQDAYTKLSTPVRSQVERGEDYATKIERQQVYTSDREPVAGRIAALKKTLYLKLRAKEKKGFESGRKRGILDDRRLDRVAARTSDRVFGKKIQTKTNKVAVSLLVDCSYSMLGDNITNARRTALLFAEVLDQLGIEFEILGYSSYGSDRTYDLASVLRLIEVKRFQDPYRRVKDQVSALVPHDLTPTGHAMQAAVDRLNQTDAATRVLFVLTDGESYGDVGGRDLDARMAYDAHVRQVLDQVARDPQFHTIGIGMGVEVKHLFGDENSLRVDNPTNLTGEFYKTLGKILDRVYLVS